MRGTDVTPEQMAAATQFIEGRIMNCAPPKNDQTVSMRYEDMIRMVAWYGAIRYKAALGGIGDVDRPGLAEEVNG